MTVFLNPNDVRVVEFAVGLALGTIDVNKWGGTALSAARNADAEADFSADDVGGLVNARLGILRAATGAYVRWSGDTIAAIAGEASGGSYFARVAAALLGRDTSDSTLRPIEARLETAGSIDVGVYRLFVDSMNRMIDAGNATVTYPFYGDFPSSMLAGRTPSGIVAPWSISLGTKYDTDGTLLIPTAMKRSVRTATVNPEALAVVGVLDCQSHPHKSLRIDFTEADTARIQVSSDNTNWVTLEDIGGTPAAFAPTTALLLEQLKAWRYVRVLAVAGFVGTATVTINAMGG